MCSVIITDLVLCVGVCVGDVFDVEAEFVQSLRQLSEVLWIVAGGDGLYSREDSPLILLHL